MGLKPMGKSLAGLSGPGGFKGKGENAGRACRRHGRTVECTRGLSEEGHLN